MCISGIYGFTVVDTVKTDVENSSKLVFNRRLNASFELVSRLSQRAAPSPWLTTLGSGIESISSPVSTDPSLRFLIIIATGQ